MRLLKICLSMAATLLMLPACGQQAGRTLPTRSLTAGVHLITAEIAADYPARMTGLMNPHELAPNHGMPFVFDTAWNACMSMANTLSPRSLAFIRFSGSLRASQGLEPR